MTPKLYTLKHMNGNVIQYSILKHPWFEDRVRVCFYTPLQSSTEVMDIEDARRHWENLWKTGNYTQMKNAVSASTDLMEHAKPVENFCDRIKNVTNKDIVFTWKPGRMVGKSTIIKMLFGPNDYLFVPHLAAKRQFLHAIDLKIMHPVARPTNRFCIGSNKVSLDSFRGVSVPNDCICWFDDFQHHTNQELPNLISTGKVFVGSPIPKCVVLG